MAVGRAKLAMEQGLSIWVLEAPDGFGDAGFHSHHAIQITVCLAGELMLASETSTVRGGAVAVATDVRHRFEARGLLAFVFVEPESASGRALAQSIFRTSGLATLDPASLPPLAEIERVFEDQTQPAKLLETARAFVHGLASTAAAPQQPDPRIRKIIDHAGESLEPSLEAAARASGVHLSPSRLRHLFVEQTGLAYKTYLLWLRMNRALQVYSEGCTLTEAAHAAGFSDSAHFSRVFKRTFGLPATTLERV